MGALDHKAYVVVGGGRGIGRATALALAREGARVLLDDSGCAADGTGHDANVAISVADEICATGGDAVACTLDAARTDTARALVELALNKFGRVDGGFYSAGFVRERALVRMSDDDFDDLLDVHVRGAFRFTRELAKALIEQKRGGSIVLTSSAAGFFGASAQAGLAAAAGAVASLVKTAATELRRHGVRVNALIPTARTRLTENLPLFRSIRADSLTPEHAAQVVCHLLSDEASDVHGELVGVAGGRIYAFRVGETSGVYNEHGPMPLAELSGRFRDVTRG